MRRFAAIILFSMAAVLCLSAQNWQTIVKDYGPAVGKVEIREGTTVLGTGSCFLISKNGQILTNAHVVTEAHFNTSRKIIVTFPQSNKPETEYTAKIDKIAASRDTDLALLKVESAFDAYCSLSTGAEPALMSEILVIGYPLGKNFKSTPGFLQAYQEIEGIGHMLDLSASVDFGNSGGPVFSKDGQVVGIVTGKIYPYNFNLALPIRTAADFIASSDRQLTTKFTTAPDSARIFLNGIYRGVTPLTVELYPRTYALLVEKDGYVSVEKTITLTESGIINEDLVPAVDKTRLELTITSTPEGARVLIDNVEHNVTPVTLDAVKGSRIRIRLLFSGYRDFYTEVTLGSNDQQTLSFTLTH